LNPVHNFFILKVTVYQQLFTIEIMDWITVVFLIAIIGGGSYFAYWGVQRTLKEDTGKNRRTRRKK